MNLLVSREHCSTVRRRAEPVHSRVRNACGLNLWKTRYPQLDRPLPMSNSMLRACSGQMLGDAIGSGSGKYKPSVVQDRCKHLSPVQIKMLALTVTVTSANPRKPEIEMGLESVKCFDCGEYGHLSKDCPAKNYAAELGDGKPPWCGSEICDRETRLVYTETADGLKASRCHACHPQSHMLPAQFARCRGCGHVVYSWDKRSECGRHLPVGKRLGYVKVTQEIPEGRALAESQAAESRTVRA